MVIGGNQNVSLTPQQASDFDRDSTNRFGGLPAICHSGFRALEGDARYHWLDLNKDGSLGYSNFLSFVAIFGQPVEQVEIIAERNQSQVTGRSLVPPTTRL